MKSKEQKEGLLEKTSAWLDLPQDTVAGLFRAEMLGDRQIRIERYKSILHCEEKEIHVDAGKKMIRIMGEDLEIRVMNAEELLIEGFFKTIELM